MKKVCRATLLAMAAATSLAGAQAQDAKAALQLRSLAATCAQCHGTDGRAPEGSLLPALAGLSRDYLAAQLTAFKAGAGAATVMPQIARGFSDAQIAQLAAYFAAQPR